MVLRSLFDPEATLPTGNMMLPSGEGTSGTQLTLPSGASRIEEEYFGTQPETPSLAPDPGQQEESGLFRAAQQKAHPSSSTGVEPHEPPTPTSEEVKSKLADFLSSFGKRKARANFISRTTQELEIGAASPEKRKELIKIMETLSRGPNRPNSGQNAAAKLILKIEAWAKGEGG